jgi:excisionase family DNA binding protein
LWFAAVSSIPEVATMRAGENTPGITPQHDSTRPITVTVEQAAALLGISRTTAYACVRDGVIPSVRLRRRILIPTQALDRLLSS